MKERDIYRKAYEKAFQEEYATSFRGMTAEGMDKGEAHRIAADGAKQRGKDAAEAATSEYMHQHGWRHEAPTEES